MSDLVERLRKLVSLHQPENGGPYAGYAAEQCVAAMAEAAAELSRRTGATGEATREAVNRAITKAMSWHPSENGPSYDETRQAVLVALTAALESAQGAGMEGWRTVPEVPTPDMIRKAVLMFDAVIDGSEWPFVVNVYRAMLASAPQPPGETSPDVLAALEEIDLIVEATLVRGDCEYGLGRISEVIRRARSARGEA